MTSRLSSPFSSCAIKGKSESVEVITASDESDLNEEAENTGTPTPTNDQTAADTPAQSGFLWRVSSGALGGVYNVATGAAGMGYNGTKWVLGKGVEIGTNVAIKSKDVSGTVIGKTAEVGSSIVSVIPIPAKLRGKDKKE